jgi:proteasome lid subunit RPN8/RPN11
MTLRIQRSLLEQLQRHGEDTYPNECCGVLVGQLDAAGDRTVKAVVKCGNTRTDWPENRYHISPVELIRIRREAHLANQDIVGFYHSHPDYPAQWSSTDLEEAHWTGCSYVITSVEKGKAVLTNAFLLLGEEQSVHFESEAIEVWQTDIALN